MKYKAFKFRLYPTTEQKTLLSKTFGCVRFVWNKAVDAFNSYGSENVVEEKTTTELRREYDWLREVSASALQQKERDFEQFQRQFFNKNRATKLGRPSFKKRSSRQSYRLTNQGFTVGQNFIRLEKIGRVPCLYHRQIPKHARLVPVTISKDKTGKHFASILVDLHIPHLEKTSKSIGLDLGVTSYLTTSEGEKVLNPKWFHESQVKLKRAHRHLSRKMKGSTRRKKCILKLNRIYQKITNQRTTYLHQLSHKIVKQYDTIAIETLKVSNMLRNRKLAKAIQNCSWSSFVSMLSYKCDWYGKTLLKVDTFYPSSKLCNDCGWKNTELQLKERNWTCQNCGTNHDRDVNAAKNILSQALHPAQEAACAQRTPSKRKTKLAWQSYDEASNKLKNVSS